MDGSSVAIGVGLGVAGALGIFLRAYRRLEARERRALKLRQEERVGRIRAEQKVAEARRTRAADSEDSRRISVEAIGVLRSPFSERNGTPWQGLNSVRGVIDVDRRWSPSLSLEGLADFSHLIVIFVFDRNIEGRTPTFRSKVNPPRAPELSLGCFSTRTPHRPSSLGLTVVSIQRVDAAKGKIWIAGVDILDGTKVVDIKPYIPAYDAVVSAKTPGWVEPDRIDFTRVEAADDVKRFLETRTSRLYPDGSMVWDALKDILQHDLRRLNQRTRDSGSHSIAFDQVRYSYQVSGTVIEVVGAQKIL